MFFPLINVVYRVSLISLVILLPFLASGQALVPQTGQLNFGVVYENAPDSVSLVLTNVLNRPVTVTGLRFYNTYGMPAFSSRDNYFTVPALGTATIWVKFSPRHNILHNTELVIENDGLRGFTRVDLVGQGRYSNAYYNRTEDKKEEALKSVIDSILAAGYDTLGYVIARDTMFMWIDNRRTNGQGATQNTLESCYTGSLAVGYTDRTDCQNNYGFNTEHTFPQSFFNQWEPMRSDLHHLFPCDNTSNTQRSDNPFAVVSSNIIWSDGGSRSDGTFFEPRDEWKGRVSRALLYFVLRYQDYNNFVQPQEQLLRTWHSDFPPDAIDRKRNDDVFSCQRNRNPFIDYPQFLERIHSVTTFSIEPLQPSLDFPEDTIAYGNIAPLSTAIFRYLIVNDGNSSVTLSNFALSQPALFSFLAGGSNLVLQPGEAHAVDIACTPSTNDSIRAFLTYQTSLAGQQNVSVPIFVNDPIVNSIVDPQKDSFVLFPNPVDDYLAVRFGSDVPRSFELTDAYGRVLRLSGRADSPFEYRFELQDLAPGTYFLRAFSANGVSSAVFIRR